MFKLGETKITEAAISGVVFKLLVLFTPMQQYIALTQAQMNAGSDLIALVIFGVIIWLRKRQKKEITIVKKLMDGEEVEVSKVVIDRQTAGYKKLAEQFKGALDK